MFKQILPFIVMSACYSQTAFPMGGAGILLGYGQDTEMFQVSHQWDWGRQLRIARNWTATGQWEADIGNWRSTEKERDKIWEVGLTPVLRLYPQQRDFYWEGGVGAHFMSNNLISERNLGTHFIFGIPVGFGWEFRGKYELGCRFQHFSNANAASHNAAINYAQIRFAISY